MNKNVRKRYLLSHWYVLLVAPIVVTFGSFFVANYLSTSKPEERFYIFISGKDIINKNLKTKVYEKFTDEYSYLLDFNLNFQVENTTTYGTFLMTDGFKYSDLIVYNQETFEDTFNTNYDKFFAPIDETIAGTRYGSAEYVYKNDMKYGIKIHSKGSPTKDENLGIEFDDADYYVSMRKDSPHHTAEDDACYTFMEAFL